MLFITYIRYVAYLDLNHAHLEVSQFFSSKCLALMEIIFVPNVYLAILPLNCYYCLVGLFLKIFYLVSIFWNDGCWN